MFSFLTENLATVIIGVLVLAMIAAIVIKLLRDRKKGKGGCGCGCSECPSAASCGRKPSE